MCGIFGYSAPASVVSRFQRGILASTLARLNDDRGGHSWGLLGSGKRGTVIHRGLGDLAPDIACAAPYETLYAHTRWATHGGRTIANAHPFEVGQIIGAHNGVISNHSALNADYGRAFAVDSMHLFAHLDAGLPFEDIEGYGAIQWVERTVPGRIHLARLDRGELSVMGIGTPDKCAGIVWSSDEDHLCEALLTAGIGQAFEYQIETGAAYYVEKHALYIDGRRCDLAERAAFIDWRKAGADKTAKVDYRLPLDGEEEEETDDQDHDLAVDAFFNRFV